MASPAESGQPTPIRCPDHGDRYLVIDGHKRIAALQQLGRDTVEATVWATSEAEALLLDRTLRFSPRESALEQGWLLAEMEFWLLAGGVGAAFRPQRHGILALISNYDQENCLINVGTEGLDTVILPPERV
ncbi:MAG: ParB N-terminal domain-containing protein [Bryobacteraceae bacterium]